MRARLQVEHGACSDSADCGTRSTSRPSSGTATGRASSASGQFSSIRLPAGSRKYSCTCPEGSSTSSLPHSLDVRARDRLVGGVEVVDRQPEVVARRRRHRRRGRGGAACRRRGATGPASRRSASRSAPSRRPRRRSGSIPRGRGGDADVIDPRRAHEREFLVFRPIGQVGSQTIDPIGSAYELPPARVLRRGRRRGVVHARRAARRHHPAVALAAHPHARVGARRRRCSTACRAASRSRPPAARCSPRRGSRCARSSAAGAARARRSRSRRGELEIATVLSMAVGVLPRHIGVWHERHPNVAIRLHEFRHRSLLEDAVEQGVADFALGPMPLRRWDGPLETVAWEEFVARRRRRTDPLAGRESVRARGACRARVGALPPRPRPRRHPRGGLPARRLPPARDRADVAGRGCRAARGRRGRHRARARQHRRSRASTARCCASSRALIRDDRRVRARATVADGRGVRRRAPLRRSGRGPAARCRSSSNDQ